MNQPQSDASRSFNSGSTWENISRKHAEVAVCTPVLDLAPERKFKRELQKSMSFNNWRADEEGHPLVCEAETKRSLSPTESQKEQLESLRAAVKSDLRRVMMKRGHSPDSAKVCTSAFMKKRNYPMFMGPKIKLPDDDSEDTSRYETQDGASPWNESESISLSDDDLLDDYWDGSDPRLISPGSQTETEISKDAWSMQPLDEFGEKTQSKKLHFMGTANQRHNHPYKRKTIENTEASFIAFSKISVPAPKSTSETNDDEEPALTDRFRNGIVSAGKKVLSSVWTWAVVAVLIAGAKIHSAYSDGQEEEAPSPTNYWIESSRLEFDWDTNVEFKFHPTRK